MLRFFSILLAFLSLSALGEIVCSLQPDESGGYLIWCRNQGGADPDDPMADVLDKDDCEELQSDLLGIIASAIGNLDYIKTDLSHVYTHVVNIDRANISIHNYLSGLDPNDPARVSIAPQSDTIHDEIALMYTWLGDTYDQVVGVQASLLTQQSKVNSYSCSDMTCSGKANGTYSCPCTEEFNQALAELTTANGMLTEIYPAIVTNGLVIAEMSVRINGISDSISSITNRLNAPDDRMWGELNDLYSTLGSRLTNVVYSTVDLTNLFYTIKNLVRGHDDQNPALQISTEGVIGLYQSVFEMVNTLQNNYSASQFDSAVKYFSNTVSRLFLDYKNIVSHQAQVFLPPASKYPVLYLAFTNNNLTARDRFQRLGAILYGAQTNWFSRMELYQQAALGWFDNFTTGAYSEEQERTTESALEHSFYETTNDLNTITAASSNLVASVDNTVLGVINELKTVQISASLPTTITLFPEIEIDHIGKLGPIDLDTTGFSDICELARKVTSLVWRVSFWLVYVVLAVGVARVVFVLVLFVINLSKSL